MRRFVIGDIHGGYRALVQVLARANFNKATDLLILLGDIVDGWPESFECVEEILTIPNRVVVLGNHDQWFLDFIHTGAKPPVWVEQGGRATLASYPNEIVPSAHVALFAEAPLYYELEGDTFVHGGLNLSISNMALQKPDTLLWDRSLLNTAWRKWRLGEVARLGWPRIFIGHTSLSNYNLTKPTKFVNVVGMDTGGGWEGKLSIMDIDTEQVWQSDKVSDLYLIKRQYESPYGQTLSFDDVVDATQSAASDRQTSANRLMRPQSARLRRVRLRSANERRLRSRSALSGSRLRRKSRLRAFEQGTREHLPKKGLTQQRRGVTGVRVSLRYGRSAMSATSRCGGRTSPSMVATRLTAASPHYAMPHATHATHLSVAASLRIIFGNILAKGPKHSQKALTTMLSLVYRHPAHKRKQRRLTDWRHFSGIPI